MDRGASRILGRGSIYTLASVAPMLTGLLVTPALTRLMPKGEYGDVSVGLALMQFALGLLTFGLPLVITRHAFVDSSGIDGARSLVLSGTTISAVTALGVAGALVALSAAVDGSPLWYLALAILTGGAGASLAMSQSFALAMDASWYYVAMAFAMSLIAPCVGLAVVATFTSDATTDLAGVTAVFGLTAAAALAWAGHGSRPASRATVVEALRLGLPLVPHQLAIGSATGAAVLVARWQLGPGGAADAQIAIWLGSAPLMIVSAIGYAWLPQILGVAEEERGASLAETSQTIAWLAALGAGTLAMTSPWFLRVLVPAEYDVDAMVETTSIVVMSSAVATIFLAHMQIVIATGQTKRFALGSPLILVLGVAVGAAALPFLGLGGLGVGYVVTYVGLAVLARHEARRHSPVRWSMSRLWPALAAVSALSIGSATLPDTGLVPTVVRLCVATACIVAALILMARTLQRGSAPAPAPKPDPAVAKDPS